MTRTGFEIDNVQDYDELRDVVSRNRDLYAFADKFIEEKIENDIKKLCDEVLNINNEKLYQLFHGRYFLQSRYENDSKQYEEYVLDYLCKTGDDEILRLLHDSNYSPLFIHKILFVTDGNVDYNILYNLLENTSFTGGTDENRNKKRSRNRAVIDIIQKERINKWNEIARLDTSIEQSNVLVIETEKNISLFKNEIRQIKWFLIKKVIFIISFILFTSLIAYKEYFPPFSLLLFSIVLGIVDMTTDIKSIQIKKIISLFSDYLSKRKEIKYMEEQITSFTNKSKSDNFTKVEIRKNMIPFKKLRIDLYLGSVDIGPRNNENHTVIHAV